jgi:hypothetical protein
MKARAEIWTPDKPELPLEKRIEGIIRNLQRLREAQTVTWEKLDEIQQSHEDSSKAESEARKSLESTLRADLESLHTDDVMLSLCGLVWLAIGLLAFVVGVMQYPKILEPLTNLGYSWLGLSVSAVYAYLGIRPKPPEPA